MDVSDRAPGPNLERNPWRNWYKWTCRNMAYGSCHPFSCAPPSLRRTLAAMHKFSSMLVRKYGQIYVGDVSSAKLVKTRMAKSVLDSGWSMLKTQLLYKGEHAGRSVEVVDEKFTTRVCGNCGSLSGPKGVGQLVVRQWECTDCGTVHDRDVNAARNILTAGLRCRASVRGNESSDSLVPSSRLRKRRRETGQETARTAA